MLPFRTYPLGDHAITLEWAQEISPVVHAAVMEAYHALQLKNIVGIKDIIPAYASLTLVYDINQVCNHYQTPHAYALLEQEVSLLQQDHSSDAAVPPGKNIELPVCYHPSLGLDISSIAIEKKRSIDEIIRLHTGTIYQVYMLGFLPGFAYMGTVPDALMIPRKTTARLQVPAGSVGIAGAQTGVYPFDSPGGWNIIGQTPIRLFDAEKAAPSFFSPGDQVKFVAISLDQFFYLKKTAEHAGA